MNNLKEKRVFTHFLVITLVLSLTFLLGKTSVLYASEIPQLTEKDQQECQLLVEQFCYAWMSGKYEVMYQTLSKEGIGKMDKEKFIRLYEGYEVEGGRLVDYSLKDAVIKGDNILVKANLKFQTEIPPKIISGSHTFNMEIDEGNWGIGYVMPPIKPPSPFALPGGSHPGE